MRVAATAEERIARPPDEVAAFAMDPHNDLRWIRGLRSARPLTDGPVRPGTRVERVAGFLGRRFRYVNEVIDLEPGRRLAMRSVEAPFPMTVTYTFEPAAGGTVARIRAEGDPGGAYALAGPLLPRLVRSGLRRDLRALKSALEP
jgi:uncharacterized protein YndB with AHSA1/START domain